MTNDDRPAARLTTSPAVRLRPPSPLTQQHWLAEDVLHRTRYALAPCGVLLLIACMTAQEREPVVADVAGRLGVSAGYAASILDQLQAEQLINDTCTPELQQFSAIRDRFAAFGWLAAVDYHLLTYDYEYLDYSVGFARDAETMQRYYAQESDTNRFKLYEGAEQRSLPSPTAALLPAPFATGWGGNGGGTLSFATLAALLSAGFGRLGNVTSAAPNVAPLMHRLSPSGGARHPSEAYLAALSVDGLAGGWYHVRVDEPALERLDCPIDRDAIRRVLPGPYRAPFPVRAVLAISSIFERNMYRYREPRTFRTVFMDAGHLAASIETIGRSLGIQTYTHHGVDDAALEQMLGLDGLQEGAILAIALG